jgi:oxygen-dependent protoporphyrinogen oxidase
MLLRLHYPLVKVRVLEASDRVGGMLGSCHVDGFTFESAALTLPATTPALQELVHALGLTDQVRTADVPVERFILAGGVAHRWPNDLSSLLRSELLTVTARLRLLWGWLPRWRTVNRGREESVHAFLARQLGAATADLLADAAVFEVSAGDARSLSLDALLPRWRALEHHHGSWLRGMSRLPPAAADRSLAGGMGTLVGALAQAVAAHLVTGARAIRLVAHGAGYRVEDAAGRAWEADTVLLALPAHAAATLLATAAPLAAENLAAIEYSPVLLAGFGFDRQRLPELLTRGHHYLPRQGGGLVRLVQVTSALFPEHAPGGRVALRVLADSPSDPGWESLENELLLKLLVQDLARATGLTSEPEVAWLQRWPHAFPNYTLGHRERVEGAREGLRALGPRVELAGSYLTGVGLADVLNGVRAALRRLIGPPSI